MNVLQETSEDGKFLVWCPGCRMYHAIWTDKSRGRPCWQFDGNMARPSFHPSLRVEYYGNKRQRQMVCHSFIKDGRWQFLSDCTHELAGKTVPMVDVDSI